MSIIHKCSVKYCIVNAIWQFSQFISGVCQSSVRQYAILIVDMRQTKFEINLASKPLDFPEPIKALNLRECVSLKRWSSFGDAMTQWHKKCKSLCMQANDLISINAFIYIYIFICIIFIRNEWFISCIIKKIKKSFSESNWRSNFGHWCDRWD